MSSNQLKIQQSLVQNLVPNPCLIDSRTEADYLQTLTDFSRLINFYDRSNIKNGNWSPFLLKDPVFIIASIAKTVFKDRYSFFINTYTQLSKAILKQPKSEFVTNGFNQLFDQLVLVFHTIERWTYYMQKSTATYNLKTYIINKVEQIFSALLWAILELKSQIILNKVINGLEPVNTYAFENFDATIWKTSKGKMPYWTLLGLQNTADGTKTCDDDSFNINCVSLSDINQALQNAGKKLFNFFNTCISYAKIELETVKTFKAEFPDTLLIRTFIDLLKVYKNQLNNVSKKHLEFYYKSILKQQKQTAVADSAFISCDLAKPTATYQLPKGTLFAAGKDTEGNTIVFESLKKVTLNPAQITTAYTLTTVTNDNQYLYLKEAPQPNIITKDENGTIEKWKTFGSQYQPEGSSINMGFSFASPMLYLTSATTRTITLQFTFINQISSVLETIFATNTSYFLSTEKDWFQVETIDASCENNILTLVITLASTDPEIVNFTKNPDGYESTWPLFKMVYAEYENLATPPQIESLNITTEVSALQDFQLYNNYGALSTKKPFQLFGPTPNVNESFIIGSAELFSKPLQKLTFNIEWNGLDEGFDFATYYLQYNAFLNGVYTDEIPWSKNNDTKSDSGTESAQMSRAFPWLNGTTESGIIYPLDTYFPYYSYNSFLVDFQLLNNSNWDAFGVDITENDIAEITYIDYLFNENKDSTSYTSTSSIQQVQSTIDPNVQNTPLEFSDESTTGFAKLQLVMPNYGFGLQLYPKVVSAIAMYNASLLINKKNTKPLAAPANPPYTPLIKTLTANYIAEATYNFKDSKNSYPIECFYYAPFQNYKVYDITEGIDYETTTIASKAVNTNTLPLFPSFNAQGQLLIALKQVIAPSKISLYIELTSDNNPPETALKMSYYYLSSSGWKTLPLLVDTTTNFACSGIITFNVPEDISETHTTIPENDFWISIATQNQPDSFAQTTFLKTNGLKVTRILSNKNTEVTPSINADVITGPQTKISQISQTLQPFPSFGGKAAETVFHRNKRTSSRLKTKGRLVSSQDYFNTIKLQFTEVYFSKTIYSQDTKITTTYVAKKVEDAANANAFLPLVSECYALHIQNTIKTQVSAFVNTAVSNFKIGYLKITAEIQISETSEPSGIAKTVNNGINVFLSPWILSAQDQITIDKGVNTAQLVTYIKTFEAVITVNSISLQLGTKDATTGSITYGDPQQEINPTDASILLVPSLNNLTDNSTITYVI